MLSWCRVVCVEYFDGLLLAIELLYPFPLILCYILSSYIFTKSSIILNLTLFTNLPIFFFILHPNLPIFFTQQPFLKSIKIMAIQMSVYISLIIPVIVSVSSSFFEKRFIFQNTGNYSFKTDISKFDPNGKGTFICEIIVVLCLLYHISSLNIPGLIFLIGAINGIVFNKFDWNSRINNCMKYNSFLILVYSLLK